MGLNLEFCWSLINIISCIHISIQVWENRSLVPHERSSQVFLKLNFKINIYFAVKMIQNGNITVTEGQSKVGYTKKSSLPFSEDRVEKVFDEESMIQNKQSKVQYEQSKVQDEQSKVQDELSKVQDEPSKIHDDESKVQDEQSQVQDEQNKIQDEQSKVEDEQSKVLDN